MIGARVPFPGDFADVYRTGPNGSGSTAPSSPWNANSYQIISPGFDQLYGLGGRNGREADLEEAVLKSLNAQLEPR